MFDKLKRFFKGAPPPLAEKIDDPVLGPLTWSEDDEAWVSSSTHAGVGFEFQISGTPEPDKALLAHAAEILRKRDAFVTAVSQFLKEESEKVRGLRYFRDEIEALQIDGVCLFWPARPDDGMISFRGGRDYRWWRCDYIGRQPKGLGFDS